MMKFLMPSLIIGVSVIGFFTFANPIYIEIGSLKAQSLSYDEALNNSKALETERDKLTKKYNTISKENLDKLSIMLPENVDNIRLILEIEKLAAPFGMVLKDIKYDSSVAEVTKTSPGGISAPGSAAPSSRKDYGTWELQFKTSGTYNNFLNFMKSLESNLRVVDIASIEFSSIDNQAISSSSQSSKNSIPVVPTYEYNFKIKTYWLKN